MELDRAVKVLDVAMDRAGMHIADARTVDEVRALRARRERTASNPLVAAAVRRGSEALFGRPPRDVTREDSPLPGPDGPLTVRWYRPSVIRADAPLVVNLHGGGWVLGDLDGGDWLCGTVASGVQAVVASVDYRLAPEHPAPAAVADTHAAVAWLAAHGAERGAGGPLAVMGDSAGGNLAALAAIEARDTDVALAAQVLIYPAVDLTRSFPSHRELPNAPILSAQDIDAFLAHYLGPDGDPADPRLSPWQVTDLSGVAPALVQTAEHDPLRDEGRAYAQRLARAGVPTRWTEYVGMPHGYASLPGICRSSRQAVAETVQFLRHHLDGEPVPG